MESADIVLVPVAEPERQQENPDTLAPAQAPVPEVTDAQTPDPDAQAAATDALVTDAQAPVTNAAAPVTDATAAITDAQPPVTDAQPPVTDAQAPVTDAPVTDAQAPVTDAQAPVTDAQAPVTDAQAPVTDAQAPVTDAQAPVTDAPVTDAQTPAKDTTVPAPDVIKSATNQSSNGGLGDTVAKHYNQLDESGLEARVKSRIVYMRNLNNWIKSVLISEFLHKIRKQNSSAYKINVLDLCSGKGGDLLKWKKGSISQLVCADIAATSVEQCESRFIDMADRNSRDRYKQTMFTAEFIPADCTKARLKDLFKDPNYAIDLTSCQFSYHYSFESYAQADMMLQNACESLKPGGYFVGTTPNAYELMKRWRATEGNTFGNEIYRVTFDSDNKEDIPLFGAKYMFHLEGVVDCPEFLVHFPTFVELAKKHGMNLVYKKTFAEYVAENSKKGDNRSLLGKMQALEQYPADEDVALLCKEEDGYTTAKEVHDKLYEEAKERGDHEGRLRRLKVGTLSKDEWDACTLYIVFAFQKEGGPVPESTEEKTSPGRKRPHEESEKTTQDTEQTTRPKKKRSHGKSEETTQDTEQTTSPKRKRPHEESEETAQDIKQTTSPNEEPEGTAQDTEPMEEPQGTAQDTETTTSMSVEPEQTAQDTEPMTSPSEEPEGTAQDTETTTSMSVEPEQTAQDTEPMTNPSEEPEGTAQETVDQEMTDDTADQGETGVTAD